MKFECFGVICKCTSAFLCSQAGGSISRCIKGPPEAPSGCFLCSGIVCRIGLWEIRLVRFVNLRRYLPSRLVLPGFRGGFPGLMFGEDVPWVLLCMHIASLNLLIGSDWFDTKLSFIPCTCHYFGTHQYLKVGVRRNLAL